MMIPPRSSVMNAYLHCPTAHLVEVARREHVGELERVGAGDLHLPLGAADVPQGHALEELPVLLERVTVVPRVVVVVVLLWGYKVGDLNILVYEMWMG